MSVWIQDLLADGQYATAWGEHETGGTRTHIASMANSYPGAEAGRAAADDVKRFISLDRPEWLGKHRA